jgi:hypothetical protein
MRQRLHIVMAVLLALGMGGCGELINTPFLVGTVHGRLTESDPALGQVSVLGAPELRSGVAPSGTFKLEDVPAGEAELFIVASANRAVRVQLTVPSGQSLHLGEVTPKEASFLELTVKAPSHQRVDEARVSVAGTPLQRLPLDRGDEVRVGPMPDGCYTLEISLPGFREVSSETCVSAGEHKQVKVNLPAPDGRNGDRGCAVTGCTEGFLCASDGRCVECLQNEHCAPGLSCRSSRCEGDGPFCAPCDGDWKCRSDATCEPMPEGGMACVERCVDDKSCEDGFTCQAGLCLPDKAWLTGCSAYRQVGAACDGEARCRELGLVNGLCLEQRCTYRCTSDAECPDSFRCEDSASGRVCQFRL